MSDDKEHKRGRSSRERGADDMIEQRPLPESRRASAALDEARLRQMFDEVVGEDVPDEFLEILRRADERGPEKS